MLSRKRFVSACAVLGLAACANHVSAKGVPPKDAACDGLDKASAGWASCLNAADALDDAQIFYAGYWLARQGRYREALTYLAAAKRPDERILTYAGFATRKLGDVGAALPLYEKALALNPDYVVARAYLGEAYLALDDVAAARKQLAEIAARCGEACAEHAELSAALAAHGG